MERDAFLMIKIIKRPKLISVIGILLIIIGLGMIICIPGFLIGIFGVFNNLPGYAEISKLDIVMSGIELFFVGPLYLISGVGILRLKKFARKLIIYVSIFSLILTFIELVMDRKKIEPLEIASKFISIFLTVFIIGYFNKKALIERFK